jgi:hypothetical protein
LRLAGLAEILDVIVLETREHRLTRVIGGYREVWLNLGGLMFILSGSNKNRG